METQTFWQGVADNWMLLAMTTLYVGAILWALRPGARTVHDEISQIPFRNETISAKSTEAN